MTNYERIFPTKSTYTEIELLIIEDIYHSFNNLAKSMGYYPIIGLYRNPLFMYMKGAMIEMLKYFIPRITHRQLTRIMHISSEQKITRHIMYYKFYGTKKEEYYGKAKKIKPEHLKDHVDSFVKELYDHLNEVCRRRYEKEAVNISSLTQVGMLLNELSATSLLNLRDLVWHEIVFRDTEDNYYKTKGKDPLVATDWWGNHKIYFYNVEHAADFFNLHPLNVAYCIKNGTMAEGMYLKRIDDSELPTPYTSTSLEKQEEYPDEDKTHLATNPHLGE